MKTVLQSENLMRKTPTAEGMIKEDISKRELDGLWGVQTESNWVL
jgi:hypothetical protein